VCFNLPVVRLFSDKALMGIVAHEFAHARIAARLGEWWHEKMKPICKVTSAPPTGCVVVGFGKEIRLMRKERDETVTAILYSREHEIRQATEPRAPGTSAGHAFCWTNTTELHRRVLKNEVRASMEPGVPRTGRFNRPGASSVSPRASIG